MRTAFLRRDSVPLSSAASSTNYDEKFLELNETKHLCMYIDYSTLSVHLESNKSTLSVEKFPILTSQQAHLMLAKKPLNRTAR